MTLLFKGSQFKKLGARRATFARQVEKMASRGEVGPAIAQLKKAWKAAKGLGNFEVAKIYETAAEFASRGKPRRSSKRRSSRRSRR